MGDSGSAVEQCMNPILNSAVLCILWGRGRHVQTAVFTQAPECKKKVHLKMGGWENKASGDRYKLLNVWIAVGLGESSC